MGAGTGEEKGHSEQSMEFNNQQNDNNTFEDEVQKPTIRKRKNKSNSFRQNNNGGACFSCLNGHISQQNSHIENRRDIKDLNKSRLNKSFGGGTYIPDTS
jgi:hypothetical protein